jgi:wyosine [tRNA(Phe)-imidazoG37] synthetase (radical SAM superfamily)
LKKINPGTFSGPATKSLSLRTNMSTFLFDKIVFGPVQSRRLGVSLGINLLPLSKKLCNFNCIYCECGWSHKHETGKMNIPSRKDVGIELEEALRKMKLAGEKPDMITFAGNGEPAMHPEFKGIAEDTANVRDQYFPDCKISLLSNSSLLHKKSIAAAMNFIDINILKLDTAIESTFQKINKPVESIKLERIIRSLAEYNRPKTIQTLFIRGLNEFEGADNTTDEEIKALIEAYRFIKPDSIMVYTFSRDTPTPDLIKITPEELINIAGRIESAGFKVELYT